MLASEEWFGARDKTRTQWHGHGQNSHALQRFQLGASQPSERCVKLQRTVEKQLNGRFSFRRGIWSGRRDSNSRLSAWEADILPLNYSRRRLQLDSTSRKAKKQDRPSPPQSHSEPALLHSCAGHSIWSRSAPPRRRRSRGRRCFQHRLRTGSSLQRQGLPAGMTGRTGDPPGQFSPPRGNSNDQDIPIAMRDAGDAGAAQ